MEPELSVRERRERARRLLCAVVAQLALSDVEAARRIGVSRRAVTYWTSNHPDAPSPAGKRLVRVEAFLLVVEKELQKKKVYKKLEELLS